MAKFERLCSHLHGLRDRVKESTDGKHQTKNAGLSHAVFITQLFIITNQPVSGAKPTTCSALLAATATQYAPPLVADNAASM